MAGNCVTLGTVTTGQTAFTGGFTTTWPDSKTSTGTITATSNGHLEQDAIVEQITGGTETAFMNLKSKTTITFALNGNGDCGANGPVTAVNVSTGKIKTK